MKLSLSSAHVILNYVKPHQLKKHTVNKPIDGYIPWTFMFEDQLHESLTFHLWLWIQNISHLLQF